MKKLFHVSCTSCGEVLFRHSEHYTTIMNYMALCALRTETTLLCFTLMSNHIHLCIETTDPKVFIKSFKRTFFEAPVIFSGRVYPSQ